MLLTISGDELSRCRLVQVLSNPELRQRYDQHGAEGVSDVNLADSAEFFGALFGSTQFDHLARY